MSIFLFGTVCICSGILTIAIGILYLEIRERRATSSVQKASEVKE